MKQKKRMKHLLLLVAISGLFVSGCSDKNKGSGTSVTTDIGKSTDGNKSVFNHATLTRNMGTELAVLLNNIEKESRYLASQKALKQLSDMVPMLSSLLPSESPDSDPMMGPLVKSLLDSELADAIFSEQNRVAQTDNSDTFKLDNASCSLLGQDATLLKTCSDLLEKLKLQIMISMPEEKKYGISIMNGDDKVSTFLFTQETLSVSLHLSSLKQLASTVLSVVDAAETLPFKASNLKELVGKIRYDLYFGESAKTTCHGGDTFCGLGYVDEPVHVVYVEGGKPIDLYVKGSFTGKPGIYAGAQANALHLEFASNTLKFDAGDLGKGEIPQITGKATLPFDNNAVLQVSDFSLGNTPSSFGMGTTQVSIDLNKTYNHVFKTFHVWLDGSRKIHEIVMDFSPFSLLVTLQNNSNADCKATEMVTLQVQPNSGSQTARLRFPVGYFFAEGTPSLPTSGDQFHTPNSDDSATCRPAEHLSIAGLLGVFMRTSECSSVSGLIVEKGSSSLTYGFTLADQSGEETLTATEGQCLALMM